MKRVLTEEHKRKLAAGRAKALANRRAKAQAKKVQKELDTLELKKLRQSNNAQLEKLKAPTPLELPPAAPESNLRSAEGKQDDDTVPEPRAVPKKKKKKKRVVVLESSSSEEEIIVVRAPRRKQKHRDAGQRQEIPRNLPPARFAVNHWNRPPPQPVPRGPTPEEINANVVRKRQAFLTQCMGDKWR